MKDNVELKINGLMCDNESCGYRDDTIKREDYENCINKPCPDCGESLLTFNDYMNVLVLENVVNEVNQMESSEIGEKEIKTVEVNLHKTITFKHEN
jgi:hypothetical protein